jgi:hypothetical protein
MSGFINNGLPQLGSLDGTELVNIDTQNVAGENPESGCVTTLNLAVMLQALGVTVDKTTVAGSRYYVSYTVGVQTQFTGVQAKIGSTGGTDKFIFELHNAAGVLVATTALAGVTVGTANTFQRIPFTAPYLAAAGNYFIAVQSNGTTAKLAVLDAPSLGVFTGSATGVFGTSASITPPTTYTADLGPVVSLYQ